MNKFFFMPLLVITCFQLAAQDANTYYQEGKKKLDDGKYKDAVSLFTKAIAQDGKDEKIYLSRSNAYLKSGELEKAFQDINTAIKINPRCHEAYSDRGYIYYLIKEPDKSILDYSSAITFAPTDSIRNRYLVSRSSSKQMKRDAKGSIEDCYEVLKTDSSNIGALNNLAMSLDDLGRDEEGLAALKKILEIDSTVFFAYMNIGFKLSKLGKYEESLIYLNKALQLNPSDAFGYNNRGYTKLMLKDYEGALADINKSIKINPSNSYAYRNKGLVYKALGKDSKACEEWDIAARYGFKNYYGNEVDELIKQNCLSK